MSESILSLRVSGAKLAFVRLFSEGSGLRQRLLGGAFWLAVGGVSSSGSTLVCAVMLARLLGIEMFGQYTILASTLGIFSMFSGPSLSWTATKFISEHREHDPRYAARIMSLTNLLALLFSGVCAASLALGAGYLASGVLRTPALKPSLLLASVILLFTGISGAQRGALAGFEAFRATAIVNLSNGLLTVGLVALLARPYGILGAVAAQGIAAALTCALGWAFLVSACRKHHVPNFILPRWQDLHVFHGFTVPLYLFSSFSMVSTWVVGVLVFHGRNGAYEMGIFGITTQVFLAGMFLPSMVCQPCLPILTAQFRPGAADQAAMVKKVIHLAVLVSVGVALLEGVAIYFWGKPILGVFGKGLDLAMPLLTITLLTTAVAAAQGPFNYFMCASGHAWLCFALSLVGMAGNLGTMLMLESGGALTATWARLVSYLILTPFMLWYYLRRLRQLSDHDNATV